MGIATVLFYIPLYLICTFVSLRLVFVIGRNNQIPSKNFKTTLHQFIGLILSGATGFIILKSIPSVGPGDIVYIYKILGITLFWPMILGIVLLLLSKVTTSSKQLLCKLSIGSLYLTPTAPWLIFLIVIFGDSITNPKY